jgi:hypothetical protein
MPFYLVSAALAGAGASWLMDRLPRWGTVLVATATLGTVALSWVWYVQPKRRDAIVFATAVDSTAVLAGRDTVVAWPHEGFVFVNRRHPGLPNVWASRWRQAPPAPGEWRSLASSRDGYWLLVHDVPTHPVRLWLLGHPLVSRFVPPASRAALASESSDDGAEILAALPPPALRLIASWPGTRLYRLGGGPEDAPAP